MTFPTGGFESVLEYLTGEILGGRVPPGSRLPNERELATQLGASRSAVREALKVLQAQGVGTVRRTPASTQKEALFGAADSTRMDDALTWAREQKIRYALAGSVDEWRYKVGVDGEPAAGVTLSILDVATGDTLWSGTGGQSGWSRQALSAVAQKLIRELLQSGLADAR